MTPVIAVRDLTKTYTVGELEGARAARRHASTSQPGEFVALTGPSGSGKSTFMHLLGCLDRPTAGHYVLNGRDVVDARQARAGARPQRRDRVRVPGLQPAVADERARERRAADALSARRRRQGAARARRRGARRRRPRRAGSITIRTSCRAASSSASPSPARWSTAGAAARRRADRQPRHAHQHRGHADLPAAERRGADHRAGHARARHRRVRARASSPSATAASAAIGRSRTGAAPTTSARRSRRRSTTTLCVRCLGQERGSPCRCGTRSGSPCGRCVATRCAPR